MPTPTTHVLAFGSFRLAPARKLLLDGDTPVRIGSRAMELLIALAERPGEVVSHEELTAIVWPRTAVEDSSLRVHIAALRKALGDGRGEARYIVNSPGRGYCFVATVTTVSEPIPMPTAQAEEAASLRGDRVPAQLTRLIGRDDALLAIAARVERSRLVTLVGPGGIGKTALAIAAAHQLSPGFESGAVFVDLSGVDQSQQVAATLATRIGVSHRPEDPLGSIEIVARNRHLLLVLDNCEHVSDGVAHIVESLLRASPRLHVLATSREPLQAESELLYRVPALGYPDETTDSARQALGHSAVQLFVERAMASSDSFRFSDDDAPHVVRICRWLGGNPLAIELLAARADLYGVRELASTLDDRALRQRHARRTAQPRHQTLSAMLEWSFTLLDEEERIVLRRLSVFRGRFTLEGARRVAAGGRIVPAHVPDRLAGLVAKSLVLADVGSEVVRYELVGMTRTFAQEKLVSDDDPPVVRERHAGYTLDELQESELAWPTADKAQWVARFGHIMDDVIAAAEWALAYAHVLLGVDLVIHGWSVGFQLSRLADFESLASRALDQLSRHSQDPARELRLLNILIYLAESQHGPSDRLSAQIERSKALTSSETGLWGRMDRAILALLRAWTAGHYDDMLAHAELVHGIATAAQDRVAHAVALRCLAQATHFAGHHDRSWALCREVLAHEVRRGPLASMTSTHDHAISMRLILARIHWIQGRAADAKGLAQEALALAQSDAPQGLCLALAFAGCPVALWSGDREEAARLIQVLDERARSQSLLALWSPWAGALAGLLATEGAGASTVQRHELAMSAARYGLLLVDHLVTVDAALPGTEHLDDRPPARTHWCTAEWLRARGERTLRMGSGSGAAIAAERDFVAAADVAQQQGALAWELRAVMSLARLGLRKPSTTDVRARLAGLLDRFGDGTATHDVREGRALLAELAGAA